MAEAKGFATTPTVLPIRSIPNWEIGNTNPTSIEFQPAAQDEPLTVASAEEEGFELTTSRFFVGLGLGA